LGGASQKPRSLDDIIQLIRNSPQAQRGNPDETLVALLSTAQLADLYANVRRLKQYARIEASSDVLTVRATQEGGQAFAHGLGLAQPYAYAVTPKESVQRVSEYLGMRDAKSALLNLGIVSQGLGLGAALDQLRVDEARLQAIRRKPLFVGFGSAEKKAQNSLPGVFGWWMGPEFSIARGKKDATFTQTPAQSPLSAVLSVPAWWRTIRLEVHRRWVNEKGRMTEELPTIAMEVPLPGDVSELTALLTGDVRDRGPSARVEQNLRVIAGKPGCIFIRGANLWRDPYVVLGAQIADRIEVLPSMGGIAAYFDTAIAWPTDKPNDQGESVQTVWVWTSQGQQAAGYIAIVPQEVTKRVAMASPSAARAKESAKPRK